MLFYVCVRVNMCTHTRPELVEGEGVPPSLDSHLHPSGLCPRATHTHTHTPHTRDTRDTRDRFVASRESALREAFDALDADGSGYLSVEEVYDALHSLHLHATRHVFDVPTQEQDAKAQAGEVAQHGACQWVVRVGSRGSHGSHGWRGVAWRGVV